MLLIRACWNKYREITRVFPARVSYTQVHTIVPIQCDVLSRILGVSAEFKESQAKMKLYDMAHSDRKMADDTD